MIQYLLLVLRVATEGLAGFSRKNGLNLRPDRMQRKFRGKTRSYKEMSRFVNSRLLWRGLQRICYFARTTFIPFAGELSSLPISAQSEVELSHFA